MCGIFGISGKVAVGSSLVSSLKNLQHRGQDGAGIVIDDTEFYVKKGLGLVKEIFESSDNSYDSAKGSVGIAHVRYTTQGSNLLQNIQPFIIDEPINIAMAHNGNVTNFRELKNEIILHGKTVDTDCDIELLLKMFSIVLCNKNVDNYSPEDFFEAVKFLHEKVLGGYAVVSIIKGYGLLGFTDPNGIRPLFLGKKEVQDDVVYCFSSESSSFKELGFKLVKRFNAGESIFIDNKNKIFIDRGDLRNHRPCIFEDLYFANPSSEAISIDDDLLIGLKRKNIGNLIAKYLIARNLTPDVIIDVPSSGYFYAQGLSLALNIPYAEALKKNHSLRTFITEHSNRDSVVTKKFVVDCNAVRGKKIAVVDDSIVRGTISKHVVSILKKAGAKEIYFISGSPKIENPCVYGIDMASKEEMIAHKKTEEEIALSIGADHVIYPEIGDLLYLYKDFGKVCDACFTGYYPTKIDKVVLNNIANEKQSRLMTLNRK